MSDQKNMIIAIALSLVILLGFQFLYEFPKMEKEKEREELLAASQPLQTPGASGGVTADGSTAPNVAAPGGAVSAPAVAQTVVTAAQRAEVDGLMHAREGPWCQMNELLYMYDML